MFWNCSAWQCGESSASIELNFITFTVVNRPTSRINMYLSSKLYMPMHFPKITFHYTVVTRGNLLNQASLELELHNLLRLISTSV